MQKKLIALAVAGLISAPAFAQSSVTLYGTLDYGYSWLGHSPAGSSVNKGMHGINSGISKANRFGLKGVEDLGNGLKAVFVLETGIDGDIDSFVKNNGRQAYAALAGGFGTLAFGRHYTPQHLFTSAVDPFGKNGVGSAANVLLQDKRLNNLLAYITPTFGGFNAIFAWSWNGAQATANGFKVGGGQEHINDAPGKLPDGVTDDLKDLGGNVNVWAVSPSYTNGGLFVGLNYHGAQINFVDSAAKDIVALHAIDLYAAYTVGPVKIGFTIGDRITTKKALDAVVTGGVDRKSDVLQGLLGVTYNVTPNDKLQFSVAAAREKSAFEGDNNARVVQYALGYEHALSKRTALYVQAALQQQNDEFEARQFAYTVTTDSKVGGLGQSNFNGATATANFTRGLALGVRHDF